MSIACARVPLGVWNERGNKEAVNLFFRRSNYSYVGICGTACTLPSVPFGYLRISYGCGMGNACDGVAQDVHVPTGFVDPFQSCASAFRICSAVAACTGR